MEYECLESGSFSGSFTHANVYGEDDSKAYLSGRVTIRSSTSTPLWT